MRDAPEMRIWTDMRRRCHLPHRPDYRNYGARGIYVCDEWRNSFSTFFRDMGLRPEGMTLERKDNDGPYSKENCIWAPMSVQRRNSRQNVFYMIFGERMILAEAAERYRININTLQNRVTTLGWDAERAVSTPIAIRHRRHK